MSPFARTFLQRTFACVFAALLITVGVAGVQRGGVPLRAQAPTDRLPTAPADPTNFPTIEALLKQSPQDTVVVFHQVAQLGQSRMTPEVAERWENLGKFLEFVDARRIRIVAFAPQLPGQSKIQPSEMLPTELTSRLRNVRPEYLGITVHGRIADRYFLEKRNGKTLLETHFKGIRNIVLISPATDEHVLVPMFEAAWSRLNVYRNVNLDARVVESRDTSHYINLVQRMRQAAWLTRQEPLALPGPLAQDPHVHYVPIGEIDGVKPTLSRWFSNSAFTREGVPLPHEIQPGTQPRTALGGFRNAMQFEAQLHVLLEDDRGFVASSRAEHDLNAKRSALVQVKHAAVKAYATVGQGKSDADIIRTVADVKLVDHTQGERFRGRTGADAFENGTAEVSVTGHGSLDATGTFTVGELTPELLGGLLIGHPHTGIGALRDAGKTPRIEHLHLRACGCAARAAIAPAPTPTWRTTKPRTRRSWCAGCTAMGWKSTK